MNIKRVTFNHIIDEERRRGYEQGAKEGLVKAQEELKRSRESGELQALRDVCQAGATVIDAMSHALNAYLNRRSQ